MYARLHGLPLFNLAWTHRFYDSPSLFLDHSLARCVCALAHHYALFHRVCALAHSDFAELERRLREAAVVAEGAAERERWERQRRESEVKAATDAVAEMDRRLRDASSTRDSTLPPAVASLLQVSWLVCDLLAMCEGSKSGARFLSFVVSLV
jgi:hypothetical protein